MSSCPVISFFQNINLDSPFLTHLNELKDTFILTVITGIASAIFSHQILDDLFIASGSFFATRVVKKLATEYNCSNYIENLATVAIRDYFYLHYLAAAIALIASWHFPIVSIIASSFCGIYCGLTFDVYSSNEMQRGLRSN